jgi:hypothetical protein
MYLSKGARVTLTTNTLSNMPTNFMSLFPLFAGVANRDLLWIGLGEEFKFHLVSWSKVCSPISERELGVWNLLIFNRALLEKWLWRYVHEREAWWRVVVDSKFGSLWGRWCSNDPIGSYGVGL